MKRLPSLLALLCAVLPLTGCSEVLYLSKLGWHQGLINYYSVSVQEALEEESVRKEAKENIRVIQEVKRYGEESLGLKKTKSYSRIFEVKGPVLYVVTASEKDQLQLYRWRFPIVGKVTYKGFFALEDALREKQRLDRESYDTYVQGAHAYSTLGWLRDPIFSSMLKWNEGTLANLILHEMSHGTLYFRDKTDFNEQMATFIGNRGAIHFLREKYGPGSKEVAEAIQAQEDDLLFSRMVEEACGRLSHFYSQDMTREEKLRGRDELFRSIKEDFGKTKARFKTGHYKDFDKLELNNAVLMAYQRYFHRLEKFDLLYQDLRGDLRSAIDLLRRVQTSKEDPSLFLERWITRRRISVPSSPR